MQTTEDSQAFLSREAYLGYLIGRNTEQMYRLLHDKICDCYAGMCFENKTPVCPKLDIPKIEYVLAAGYNP